MINKIRTVAAAKPYAIALCYGEHEMNYSEFMQRVDGLASSLQGRDIGPGQRVVIALPRSFEMIIAICAVLAVGAAYVPLDPSNPTSRITTILEDCNPALLLVDTVSFSTSSAVPILMSTDWNTNGKVMPFKNAGNAYIIYTSGSTGTPKGVEISCEALENYVKWAVTELPFTGAGVPLFTSISFDHAITNIFPPLLMGEKIKLLGPIHGGRTLASVLLPDQSSEKKYSYVKITPSLFSFLNKEQRAQLGCVTDLLMFGGEKLPPEFIKDARRENPNLKIMNHYGPTEATVGCCVFQVPTTFSGTHVPIGKAIPGMETSIRRADFSIAEKGETGELYVSGISLAKGYWKKAALTKNVFLVPTANNDKAKRWYKTGDLVYEDTQGMINYLGRADDQLKILGNRIEPAEIIQQLNSFPQVKQATVFVNENSASVELIAALTFFSDKPTVEEIRKYLQNSLPAAMVPTRYLLLDEIPVAASGKMDIKKLAALLPESTSDVTVEEGVANKFKEILCKENIGPMDDYFLLGGDSLGTVEIVTWATEEYKIELDIACLFEYPTINALAKHIRSLMSETTV